MWRETFDVVNKELRLSLASPIAWLFLATFAAISLFVVFWGEAFFARDIADVRPLFEWMPLLLVPLAGALTMRTWSEERRTGTLEHVLTSPTPLAAFALGKWLACLALLALALLVTVPLPVTVALMADLDAGPVFAGYLATFLLGGAYLAIGLYVSSRTANQIVALIGTVAICGLLWLVGSPLLTDAVSQGAAELMRAFGTGSRFDAISRGVIELPDLVYFLSLAAAALAVTVYVLERERWSASGEARPRHRRWRAVAALVVANALATNLWAARLDGARIDTTDGGRFTLSDATVTLLGQLQEPLLLRGYFGDKTHPLLSPLVPEVRDLLREYEAAADGRLRVEFVDPTTDAEAAEEASARYGIEPVPFQVSDRYESSIVSGWFDVLVSYGDRTEVLGFRDLIDVRQRGETGLDVRLRNPEYDLSRAIRRVVSDFRTGGGALANLARPVRLSIWSSDPARLPAELASYRAEVEGIARERAGSSGGTLSVDVADPDADSGALGERLARDFGLRPLSAGPFSDERFWFTLALDDGERLVPLGLDELTADSFRAELDAALERFAGGFTRTVALAAPLPPNPAAMAPDAAPGPSFRLLEDYLAAEYSVVPEDLSDGRVSSEADLLIVAAPESLDERGRFAVDQFLMSGGTVIVATSPYTAAMTRDAIALQPRDSGLSDWLAHNGVAIDDTLVLDPTNARFPVPVARNVGGFQMQELQLLDYPYFPDVRGGGIADDSPITRDLPQVTMAWASPIADAEPGEGRTRRTLLQSSPGSWTSGSSDVMPRLDADGGPAWTPEGETGSRALAVETAGTFESFFKGKPSPLVATEAPTGPSDEGGNGASEAANGGLADDVPDNEGAAEDAGPVLVDSLDAVIERSPESARLVVFASNDFLSDVVTQTVGSIGGSDYLAPYQMVANAVDAALDDSGLSGIRARGEFNRTLPPMDDGARRAWELANYALAALAIGLVWLVARVLRRRRERRQLAWMIDDGPTAGATA